MKKIFCKAVITLGIIAAIALIGSVTPPKAVTVVIMSGVFVWLVYALVHTLWEIWEGK